MRGRLVASALSVLIAPPVVAIAVADGAQAASTGSIGCGQVAGSTTSGTEDHSRVVLGIVSVPPARIQRATPDSSASPWRDFAKYGLAIHTGSTPVVVSVPAGWTKRVAITWGSVTPFSRVRFQACHHPGGSTGRWNGYAGGFYLDVQAACVPLTVTVGRKSKTVRVGVGTSCGGR
jgi:hypothetical protein